MQTEDVRDKRQEWKLSVALLLSDNTRQSRDSRVVSHDSYLMTLRLKGAC